MTSKSSVCAYILADHRENNGAIPYLPVEVEKSNDLDATRIPYTSGGGEIIYNVQNNAIYGDYTILIPSKLNPSKNITAVIFERKTWEDLAASIKTTRFEEQHKKMSAYKEAYGAHVYYIIEGGMSYGDNTSINKIPFKNLIAKARTMLLEGIPFIQTKNAMHTAEYLVHFARDIAKLYRQDRLTFPKQEETQNPRAVLLNDLDAIREKYMLMSTTDPLKDVISDAVQSIMDLIGTKSNETPLLQPVEATGGAEIYIPPSLKQKPESSNSDTIRSMWVSIKGVSTTTAPLFMSILDIKTLITCEEPETMKTVISNIVMPSGKKFGPTRAKEVMKIIGDDQIARDAQVRIIACIRGITIETSSLILDKVSLKTICKTIMEKIQINIDELKDTIAAIKKANDTKIGNAMANRIIETLS